MFVESRMSSEGGFRQLQRRFGAIVVGLVGPRIDDHQHVVFLDELAFAEQHLVYVAGCPRAYFDGVHGLEPARILVPVLDALADDLRHRHFRGALRWRRCFIAADMTSTSMNRRRPFPVSARASRWAPTR